MDIQRFTDRVRTVLQLANQEAQRVNVEYIDDMHLLAGLLKEGNGIAAHVLQTRDLSLNKIRGNMTVGTDAVIMEKLPQTPTVKKIIEEAIQFAYELNHDYVGTEHLLVGLVRVPCFAAGMMAMSGLTRETTELEVINLVVPNSTKKEPPTVSDSDLVPFAVHLSEDGQTATITIGADRFRAILEMLSDKLKK